MEATISSNDVSGSFRDADPLPDKKPKAPEKTATPYRVLGRVDDDPRSVYREFPVVKATGPSDARRQVIEASSDVAAAVAEGTITLVAISERFWSEKRPSQQTKVSLDA